MRSTEQSQRGQHCHRSTCEAGGGRGRGFTAERHRPRTCGALKVRNNFHRTEGEKEEWSSPPLVKTL